jgi:hypothetical protein
VKIFNLLENIFIILEEKKMIKNQKKIYVN